MTDDGDDLLGGLYDAPPERFVAARDEIVKRIRAAGDRKGAAAVAKLRRPTVGAWAVNRLSRHRPDLIEELLAIGDRMRSAQRELRGADMRELATQRRAVVEELTRAAVVLARREHRRDNIPVVDIESTLTAALADPEVAALVRAGRLARTVEYTGFGETPRPQLRLMQGGLADAQPEIAEPAPARGNAERPPGPEIAKRPPAPQIDVGLSGPAPGRRPVPDSPTSMESRAGDAAAGDAPAAEAPPDGHSVDEQPAHAAEPTPDEVQVAADRLLAEQTAAAERRAAQRAAEAQRKRARAAAHRELLAARTELAEAEAARTAAERAVRAAKRRVEKVSAALAELGDQDRT